MYKQNLRQKGFTLAEMMIVITVIAIVTVVTVRIQKSRTYYETRFLTYSAYTNLKHAAGELLADGYELNPSTGIIKSLPIVANYPTADATYPVGLCQRITDIMNTTGSIDCSQTNGGANFNTATPNFITTNGQRFFNFGTDPVSDIYTVYVDINGKNAKSNDALNKDVLKFQVYTNGIVLLDSTAATDKNYITASVKIVTGSSVTYVAQNVDFKTAACTANLTADATYCGGISASGSCPSTNNPCEVYINKPGY